MVSDSIHTAKTEYSNSLLDAESLERLIKSYPQVSAYRSMLAKVQGTEILPGARKSLKLASLYSHDRKQLFDLINHQAAIRVALDQNEEIIQEPLNQEKKVEPVKEVTAHKSEEETLLEKEILQHAVSSSILLDVKQDLETLESLEQNNHNEEEIVEETIPENFDSLGLIDWLKIEEPKKSEGEKEKPAQDLIDQFIKSDPGKIKLEDSPRTMVSIERPKQEFFSVEELAKHSLEPHEEDVTETLAGIYASQGNIEKAKKAYQKLSLKFPEKSNYFARLIQELGNKH